MDTSMAIHPERFQKDMPKQYNSPGKVLGIVHNDHGAAFECEQGMLHVHFYNDNIVRIVFDVGHRPIDFMSYAVEMVPLTVNLEVATTDEAVLIHSNVLTVRVELSAARVTFIDKQSGLIRLEEPERGMLFTAGGEVACRKIAQADDRFYGFGEKAGFLDKKGERLVMWNTDVYAPHNQETDPLYVSIPYYMALRGSEAHGIFFDNTYKTVFDLRHETEVLFQAAGGLLDYYFMAGPHPKDVVKQYTLLTGKAPLPPKWALGYHQSRYSYQSQNEVNELVESFIARGIPLDAVHLDIHFMDEYRVFTIDENRFPDFGGMVEALKDKGIRVVTIVDPGVKADSEYAVYVEGVQNQMFCRDIEGNIYHGPVWPGKSAFPDFTSERVRAWWGKLHSGLVKNGVSGIWNDMNEPAVFNESKTMDLNIMHENDGRPGTHRELHNIYGSQMARATYEGLRKERENERPFILTRAAFAGIQKYAAIWTGDNRSFWEHLQMMIPMCLNLGLSGVPFSGADVGGFAHDAQAELLIRWTQAAAFTPYFRNHSELKSSRQEPWVFGEETEALIREAIQLRYTWFSQLYVLMEEASRTGLPPMRPLMLEFPDDAMTYRLSDQFMLGDNVIVAPIIRPDSHHRVVYLPEGDWINYWSGQWLVGKKHHVAYAPMNEIPIFIKANSAILQDSPRTSTAQRVEEQALHLYVRDKPFNYRIFDDDGETFNHEKGQRFEAVGTVSLDDGKLTITEEVKRSGWTPNWEYRSIVIHSDVAIHTVVWNGDVISDLQLERSSEGNLKFNIDVS